MGEGIDVIEESVEVAAPAEVVYGLLADLPRMGEWSPECRGVSWRRGCDGAEVGARFIGHNGRGIRRWNTQGKVIAAEAGRELAWEVHALGLADSRWGYRIEPGADGGCRVTEWTQDRRGGFLTLIGPLVSGVKDRTAYNRESMRVTLSRLKMAAEAAATANPVDPSL
jgi:hypothetical protein